MKRVLQKRHYDAFAECVRQARMRTFDKGYNKFESFNACLAMELVKTNPEFSVSKWLAATVERRDEF